MTFHTQNNLPRRQQGVGALMVAVVLLISATLVVLYTSRSTILEQKISANEVRARQAFAAAQAGVDHLFAKAQVDGVAKCTAGCNSGTPTYTYSDRTDDLPLVGGERRLSFSIPDNNTRYQATFCDAAQYTSTTDSTNPSDNTMPPCPAAYSTSIQCNIGSESGNRCKCPGTGATRFIVRACGWSEDDGARQSVSQLVGTTPVVASAPTNPLISLSTINVQGSATVTNFYNNLTIWSGGNIANIGNSGKTFVHNPGIEQPSIDTAPPDPPTTCAPSANYICTSDKSKIGPDIVDRDLGLAGLTGGEFFKNFFGTDGLSYKTTTVSPENILNAGQFSTMADKGGKVFWIEGNADTANIDTGVPAPNYAITNPEDAGYYGKPNVVIVNGDLSGGGNFEMWGILYVAGNMNLSGNITVHGTAIIQGQVSGTGSLDVIFDPRAVAGAANTTGLKGGMAGGWRDW